MNNAPWLGGEILALARKGSANLVPENPSTNRRSPVTIAQITALRSHLDLTNSFDAAVFAVACVAFWACCRLGELTIPSRNSFDPTYHVSRSTTVKSGAAREGRAFTTFRIPYSKTKRHRGDEIQLIDIDDPTNPIAAFNHHLRSNAGIPNTAPLFAFRTLDGSWAPMTKSWMLERCNEIWSQTGFDILTGHSLRIGGTTHLLTMGIDPWIVMIIGRWTSTAFVLYWRKVENILPQFISDGYDSAALSLRMSRICQGFART